MVRPGYMLYGYYPNDELRQKVKLLPALTFSTVIVHIKDVPANTPIGYGRSFVTARPSRIATVAVGYSDGVSRRLSNRGNLVVNGQLAPIVGKVCMDLTMIDITDISGEVKVGDEVFVFDNVNITIDDIAELCGTIGYEVIAQLEDKADRVEKF
jgi:alanine racemase